MFKNLKIGTKLILAALTIVTIVTIINGYVIFNSAKQRLESQVLSDLERTVEIKKQNLFDYLDHLQGRAIDFASDGFVRNSLKEMVENKDKNKVKELQNDINKYLRENKQVLEATVYGINIFDMNENIIASTSDGEIGIHESGDEYFLGAQNLNFGESYSGPIFFGRHFYVMAPTIAVSAPIFDIDGKKRIGVLVNYNNTDKLNEIFRVLRPIKNSIQPKGKQDTMETYLVDENGFMITQSIFVKDSILKQKVDTEPVIKCRDRKGGMSGLYPDYRSILVYGSSLCLDNGWILLAEIDQTEISKNFLSVGKNIILLFLTILFGASMFVYFMSRGIIGRIKRLSESVTEIGEGNLMEKIKVESRDEIGQLASVFNIMVGKLKKSYEDIEREKNISERRANDLYKFKLALDNASDLVTITDPQGTILYVNKTVSSVAGYDREEAIGENPSLWGRQMSAEFYGKMWDTIKNKKTPFFSELINKRKNGEKYNAEIYICPILTPEKEVEFFLGVERDITKLKEVDKAKNEFVSFASHQLLTPLTTIRWLTEILLDKNEKKITAKGRKEYLENIDRIDENMIELVKSLLDVSRIELGTFSIQPEPVNIKDVIESILEELIPKIKNKKIEIIKEYSKLIPIISMDQKLIRMVCQNILTNAVKYTPEKGKVVIAFNIDEKERFIMSFSDSGYGILKSDYSKIFTKFYRGENIKQKEPEGTGLGLYIVKSIIDNSGGKIWFESEEGTGTTFYISYPKEGMVKKAGEKSLV